ncbi:MAG: methionine--tRNA ligase [Theionarchaea archaeon]|nr:methionine--tRNA ligase [Theionarchaea archaeon]
MKILVTAALPYVNNVPHLGNLIPVLSADVFARFKRMKEEPIIYICGTDEHGTATETVAMREGMTPQEICDKYYKIHKDSYEWLNIQFDLFGRTSRPYQHAITQDIFLKLYENGYIFEQELEQTYCQECERFLADRYIEGQCPHCGYENARGDQCENCGKIYDSKDLINARCSLCGGTPIIRNTNHLFLDLPQFEESLLSFIESRKSTWSTNAVNFSLAWIREGLEARCITRDLEWGVHVPLPGWEDKVFYVWFDAPIGYISMTQEYCEKTGTDWEDWWKQPEEVKLYQFMGKDNIPFHTVIFPATLMGTHEPYTLLHQISVNEYITYEGGPFSKSKGLGIFCDDVMTSGISPEVWRYYLLISRPEKQDSHFYWEDLQEKTNAELVGNLGNFVFRTLSFTHRYLKGQIHEVPLTREDTDFIAEVDEKIQTIEELIEQCELKSALKEIMRVSRMGNQYFQEHEPWKQKDTQKKTLFICVNLVAKLALLLEPYLPITSRAMRDQLGMKTECTWSQVTGLPISSTTIPEPHLLFTPIEDEAITLLKKSHGGMKVKLKDQIPYTHFEKLDIRVGTIIKAENHPNADKLVVLTVDIGAPVTVVAGIKKWYTPEQLKGNRVILLANLEPVTLRGVQSNGMILAAQDENGVSLLTVDRDVESGSPIL